MRIIEREFDAFAEDHFPDMNLVRAWTDCKIWSAGVEQHLLVLVDSALQRFAIFDYDTCTEREHDIQLVSNLPDSEGGPNGPICAVIGPKPPNRSASAAQAIPTEENENPQQ